MSCKTCINYGIYEMITSRKLYGYSGNIPCNRCSRYRTFEDLYIENTLFKPSVPSVEEIAEAIPYRCTVTMNKNIRFNIAQTIHNLLGGK